MHPMEYGISLYSVFESSYINNAIEIIKILKAVFYNAKVNDSSLNDYSLSKKYEFI